MPATRQPHQKSTHKKTGSEAPAQHSDPGRGTSVKERPAMAEDDILLEGFMSPEPAPTTAPPLRPAVPRMPSIAEHTAPSDARMDGQLGVVIAAEHASTATAHKQPKKRKRKPSAGGSRRASEDTGPPADAAPLAKAGQAPRPRRRSSGSGSTKTSGKPSGNSKRRRTSTPTPAAAPAPASDEQYEAALERPELERLGDAMENVFAFVDDAALRPTGGVEDVSLPLDLLARLRSELDKAKVHATFLEVSVDKLRRLIDCCSNNVVNLGRRSLVSGCSEEEEDEFLACMEAMLAILLIITTPNVSREVVVEDTVELLASFAKLQMEKTVFPHFDPDSGPSLERANSSGARRAAATAASLPTAIKALYNKLCNAAGLFADLLAAQSLPDSILLQLAQLGIAPFFAQGNLRQLQLNSLNIASAIFSRYHRHRDPMIEEILVNVGGSPGSRRITRCYKAGSHDITMLTALILHLIQGSVVHDLRNVHGIGGSEREANGTAGGGLGAAPREIYNAAEVNASRIGQFLLNKCVGTGKGTNSVNTDFKILFEYVLEDLLKVLFAPEWPAAEAIVFQITRLLTMRLGDKSVSQHVRALAIDSMGSIAAAICKARKADEGNTFEDLAAAAEALNPGLCSRCGEPCADTEFVVGCIMCQRLWHGDCAGLRQGLGGAGEEDLDDPDALDESDDHDTWTCAGCRVEKVLLDYSRPGVDVQRFAEQQKLQDLLLDSLVATVRDDASVSHAQDFYVAQWLSELSTVQDGEADGGDGMMDSSPDAPVLGVFQKRQSQLFSRLVGSEPASPTIAQAQAQAPAPKHALAIVRRLAQARPLMKGFTKLLEHLVAFLGHIEVKVRTRALRSLAAVVSVDPDILAAENVKKSVQMRFLDKQTSVRQAAVELVGQFVMSRPGLTDQYYSVFSDRILDFGISVRKSVVKIFQSICSQQPQYERVPDICCKLLRRMDDDAAVKDLVVKALSSIWFMPSGDACLSSPVERAITITRVLAAPGRQQQVHQAKFKDLLTQLFDGDATATPVRAVCREMVDGLVKLLSDIETSSESPAEGEPRALSALEKQQESAAVLTLLSMFCQADASLLLDHGLELLSYLHVQMPDGAGQAEQRLAATIVRNTAAIIEGVLPLLAAPDSLAITKLEESLVALLFTFPTQCIEACVSCLHASVTHVTENIELARETLEKFYSYLKIESAKKPKDVKIGNVARALLASGHICQFFDFEEPSPEETNPRRELDTESIRDVVFIMQLHFASHLNAVAQYHALNALGCLCMKHPYYMLRREMLNLYNTVLDGQQSSLKIQLLRNFAKYLIAEEKRLTAAQQQTKGKAKAERDLRALGGEDNGVSSTLMCQLEDKLYATALSVDDPGLRRQALKVIAVLLRQGIVNPMNLVSPLVCLSTDSVSIIRTQATAVLTDLSERHPGFVRQKSGEGCVSTFAFQQGLLATPPGALNKPAAGYLVTPENSRRLSLLAGIYGVQRARTKDRRAFVDALLKVFHGVKDVSVVRARYFAEAIAYLPFVAILEPLYICFRIDSLVSEHGATLQEAMRACLGYTFEDDEDAEEDAATVAGRLTKEALPEFARLCCRTQVLSVLLLLKLFLQQTFSISDARLQNFRPDDAAKKHALPADPIPDSQLVLPPQLLQTSRAHDRKGLVEQYHLFRQLMVRGEFPPDMVPTPRRPPPQRRQSSSSKKTPARRRSSSGSKRAPPSSKGKAKGKAKKRRRLGSDTDDSDDEDFVP